MDQLAKSLLEMIVRASLPNLDGISAAKFRAQHHEHLDKLNELEWGHYLERRADKYRLSLYGLSEVLSSVDEIQFLLQRFEILFQVLKQHYEEHLGDNLSLNDLAEASDLTREEANIALTFIVDAPIFHSRTTDINSADAVVAPSEDILRYERFSEVIEKMKILHSASLQNRSPIEDALASQNDNIEDFQFLLHPMIIEHALPQYKSGYLREAVFNSIVAVFDLIRQKTGLINLDGSYLIDEAFSLEHPYLVLSNLDTDTGQNDQKGFLQIFRGAYQGIRNPKAHSLSNDLTPLKAAQYLVFASLLARRIGEAKVIKKEQV